ncbi:MAG TPA: hypothetical protein VK427_06430 [Kofleriaceae bacterium]|nr:hypothetical protein [Kofleriaceae bacterium]
MKWLCILALAVGCKKSQEAPPPPPNNAPAIPAPEMKRGEHACNTYIAKACTCAETVPAAKAKCTQAQAFPEVLRMGAELTMSTDSEPKDVKQATGTIRKTIAECIEQTAQLPALGCPP